MNDSKFPARPSLDSLRKQAKKLAREIVAGDATPISRAHAHLPKAKLQLSLRDSQLVLAREHGFSGWKDLVKEVEQRLGRALDLAVSDARRIIHDNDVERLRQLLADYPKLLLWKYDERDGGLLGMATGSYGDSFDPVSEGHFTRSECAELLLDAGAFVEPSICEKLIQSPAQGLMGVFHRRKLFPQTLKYLAALGDVEGIRALLDTNTDGLAAVNEALMYACHLRHAGAAALLLDRSIVLDAELGQKIDVGPGRAAFIDYFIANKPDVHDPRPFSPWQAFVKEKISRALQEGDLASFIDGLHHEAWLLSDDQVEFQARMVEVSILNDQGALLAAFFDLDPALLHRRVPPPSSAVEFAFTYVKTHLLPLVFRVWPLPDDLPHAAGNGDLAGVKRWFDSEGKFGPCELKNHFPLTNAQYCSDYVTWFGKRPDAQRVLDTALAWAVLNNRFEVADYLLAHGADVNTNWCSHEPASMLHELVWHKNYEGMQFLIDRGIDMTIHDYRWHATAESWARVAAKDDKLGQFMHDAQQRREQASR